MTTSGERSDGMGSGSRAAGTMAGTSTGMSPDADRRAVVRAFVRRHHPDVGGDPEVFRIGLARLRGDAALDPRSGALAADDPRLDVPVVAVRSVTIHRLGRLGRRLVRRYDPRPSSARVH